MLRLPERALLLLVGLGDRVVPKHAEVVLRTGPDFDDQGREMVAALVRAGHTRITWLVNNTTGAPSPGPIAATVVRARSFAGLRAYWRARVVVHTHGVYGSRRTSSKKTFVNIWHGMPVKRLESGSDVGRNQTDLTIATSPIHAENLASTWHLRPEQVAITGLPRNDVLVANPGAARPVLPPELARRSGGRPLVVWLPTFRRNMADSVVDGVDTGTDTQFAGATAEAVSEALGRIGAYAILKVHPLAPPPARAKLSNLEVWSEDDLARSGLTLYYLLACADVLVSDHSSVWIDFLLTQRPMIFAMSDLDEYTDSRGFYFPSVEALLPGPLVTDLAGLERELAAVAAGDDRWVARRSEDLQVHHVHRGADSADRVAELVMKALRGA